MRERVALALIASGELRVLQLRDFSAGIADPGQWGLFGGHLIDDESAAAGVRRELSEEIGWCPAHLRLLGTFQSQQKDIVVFGLELTQNVDALALSEGQEIGQFRRFELDAGEAYSTRWGRNFPLTSITLEVLRRWDPVLRS